MTPKSAKAPDIDTQTPPVESTEDTTNGDNVLMCGPGTSEETKLKPNLERKLESVFETIDTDSVSATDAVCSFGDLHLPGPLFVH
jgi:hypothetical protein